MRFGDGAWRMLDGVVPHYLARVESAAAFHFRTHFHYAAEQHRFALEQLIAQLHRGRRLVRLNAVANRGRCAVHDLRIRTACGNDGHVMRREPKADTERP